MEQMHASSQIGSLTFTDLSDTKVFQTPAVKDAWGVYRRPYVPALARMSAELSADVYGLDIQPWMDAGFEDCTFVVEGRVVLLDRDRDTRIAAIEAEWRRYRARARMKGIRPVEDLLRATRQLYVTDMGKTIIMTKTLADGKVVVALSFMGTTEKFFDWFTNFKVKDKEGMHFGFRELAIQFDKQANKVMLPSVSSHEEETAYTLADVLEEAKLHPDQYIFWISGHSQGGALVQTYVHLLLEKGVLPEQIFAYSFAAPTVAYKGMTENPGAYPIYHIINYDDIVPRTGAQLRLGIDCAYFPDDAFRSVCYKVEPETLPAFMYMIDAVHGMKTTQDVFYMGLALMQWIQKGAEDAESSEFWGEVIPRYSMMAKLGVNIGDVAEYVITKMGESYAEVTGKQYDDEALSLCTEKIKKAVDEFGVYATVKAMTCAMALPHVICPDKKEEMPLTPYSVIVRKYSHVFRYGTWIQDGKPECVTLQGEPLSP